jgi:hypothetical protein
MPKRHPSWALTLLLAHLLFGCGADEQAPDATGGQALWNEIQTLDYQSWGRAPGYETPQPTTGAHGRSAIVLLNPVAAEALESPSPLGAWPDGTLIVKDSYDGGVLTLVAAMKKSSQSWYFAEWSPDGSVRFAGEPSVCTGCHGPANDRVRAVALP